jgi:hypothetical protein
VSPEDKAALITALREVADAIERDGDASVQLIETLGTELLVAAISHGDQEGPQAEALARREIAGIRDNMAAFHQYQVDEAGILNERLMRRFDPQMALNEATNRAIAAKKAARESILLLTPKQEWMMEQFTKPTLARALRNA